MKTFKQQFDEIPHDLILLAFVNGLSGMALSGAALFGILSVLSGTFFLHGAMGLAFFIAISALATFFGYAGVCRYAASFRIKSSAILYAVFIIHGVGFVGAAMIHPLCVSLSSGLGLGMFYAVFMLKSINDIHDQARDAYATVNGLIARVMTVIAPLLGAGMVFIGSKIGVHDPLLPTFLTFAACVVCALPLITHLPNVPLSYSHHQSLKSVIERRHLPAISLFLSTIACERLMMPLLLIGSLALLGGVQDAGWFASGIAIMSAVSLFLSHYVRLPGKRWVILGVSVIGIGLSFLVFDRIFSLSALLFVGGCYAVLSVTYQASWYALATRVVEVEWGHSGHNQALLLGEVLVLVSRLGVALLIFMCAYLNFSLKENMTILTFVYLAAAGICVFSARLLDVKYKHLTEAHHAIHP